MQRRQFLKTAGLAATGMILNNSERFTNSARASGGRPLNFILIMADDLG
ncbi:MAG: twin-arginine translocation signal domain-containing protein, partial [Planctomycetota bacterium]